MMYFMGYDVLPVYFVYRRVQGFMLQWANSEW